MTELNFTEGFDAIFGADLRKAAKAIEPKKTTAKTKDTTTAIPDGREFIKEFFGF